MLTGLVLPVAGRLLGAQGLVVGRWLKLHVRGAGHWVLGVTGIHLLTAVTVLTPQRGKSGGWSHLGH